MPSRSTEPTESDSTPSTSTRVDTHAHVFHRGLPLTTGHRHAPQLDAMLPELLAHFDAHGVTHGLLTAPSFLGTDNSYLLAALAAAPWRLRGTVIIDEVFDPAALQDMARLGVVGIRLNMLQRPSLHDLRSPFWRRVLETVVALNWHVEIYVESARLDQLMLPALEAGAKVVVDHFGSPGPALGLRCPGFHGLLDALQAGRTWVKLSAPYRLGGMDAAPVASALLAAGGPQRLLWASDWPWTQNSAGMTYGKCLNWLEQWVPVAAQRDIILGETPATLLGFNQIGH